MEQVLGREDLRLTLRGEWKERGISKQRWAQNAETQDDSQGVALSYICPFVWTVSPTGCAWVNPTQRHTTGQLRMRYCQPALNGFGGLMASKLNKPADNSSAPAASAVLTHRGVCGEAPAEVSVHGHWRSSRERIHVRDVGAAYAWDQGTPA